MLLYGPTQWFSSQKVQSCPPNGQWSQTPFRYSANLSPISIWKSLKPFQHLIVITTGSAVFWSSGESIYLGKRMFLIIVYDMPRCLALRVLFNVQVTRSQRDDVIFTTDFLTDFTMATYMFRYKIVGWRRPTIPLFWDVGSIVGSFDHLDQHCWVHACVVDYGCHTETCWIRGERKCWMKSWVRCWVVWPELYTPIMVIF